MGNQLLDKDTYIFSDIAINKKLQVQLWEQERNERLQGFNRQIFGSVEQIHFSPGSFSQQYVGEISGVLVRLLRSEINHQQHTSSNHRHELTR